MVTEFINFACQKQTNFPIMKSAQNSRFAQSFQENEKAGCRPFPEEFPIYLTHNEFPSSAKVSSEMEMPLGMIARPLADINYANM